MKNEKEHKDRQHKGRKDHESRHRGAKTFRRGRAIAFLEMMNLKRSTLKQQLETPELQSINPVLVGELKAIDMAIQEFVHLFELQNEMNAMGREDKENNESPDGDDKKE